MKRLYRSRENKIIFGILGGVGEYLNVDPAIIRLIYVLLLFATGIVPLLLGYFIAVFVVPEKPTA